MFADKGRVSCIWYALSQYQRGMDMYCTVLVFFFFLCNLAFQAHMNIHRIDDVVINRDFVVWAFNFIELEISWNKGLLKKFFFCACEKHSKLTLGVWSTDESCCLEG